MQAALRHFTVALLLATCGIVFAQAKPDGAAASESLVARPELASQLKTVLELLQAKKYPDASSLLDSANALKDKTPAEQYLIGRYRASLASSTGDAKGTTQALEQVLATRLGSALEQQGFIEVLAGNYLKLGSYKAASEWVENYFSKGGSKWNLRLMQAQALYLAGDYAAAQQALQRTAEAQKAVSAQASKTQLELMASSALKLKDEASYKAALELLIAQYPSPAYWADLLSRIESQPGFAADTAIDLHRLAWHVGAFEETSEFIELAEEALKAGFPAEAQAVLASGTQAGLVGKGPQAAAHQQLQAKAQRLAADDATQIQSAQAPASQDADKLFAYGYNLYSIGDKVKALRLMEQALGMGVKRPDLARLRLGAAWLRIGDKAAASPWLQAVSGSDGSKDLARLWLLVR